MIQRLYRMATLIIPILILTGIGSGSLFAQQVKILDKIVAQVNNHIILKSDIDSLVTEILLRERNLQYSDQIWYEILESQIDKYLLIEQAAIDSVTVGEDQVERRLEDYMSQLITQFGSEKALEDAIGKGIYEYKAEWRPRIQESELSNKMREIARSKVTISRREVEDFLSKIPQDSLPVIPEQVQMAHIVAIPPISEEAKKRAFDFAMVLRDSILIHHAPIEELARRHSADPTAKQNGGLIPLMNMSDLVAEFSAAAAALEPNQISEVVETIFGYHVIRLNKRVGDQIEVNHILIQINSSEAEDVIAIGRLEAIRDSLINHNKSFTEMARKYSEDKATAPYGGRLRDPMTYETMLDIDRLDPALYSMVILLDNVGDISNPRPYNIPPSPSQRELRKAYRLVQLQKRVPQHRANIKDDYTLISNYALQRKQIAELTTYLDGLRKSIYVEYKIQKPSFN